MSARLGCAIAALSLLGCETPLTLPSVAAMLGANNRASQTTDRRAPSAPTVPLPAPKGLSATSGELRAIPLKWDPLLASGVSGYVVERARQPEGPFWEVARLDGPARSAWVDRGPGLVAGATSGGDDAIEDGQTFYYRVRPLTEAGAVGADPSEIASGTAAPAPDPPEEVRAFSHQPRNVPLSWRASPDPTVAGYVVERSPTSRGPFETVVELDGRFDTVYVDRGLGALRVFHYRIASVNRADGRGVASKPVRAVTKAEPLPPIGLRIVSQALGANELAWEPNVEADLTSYELLRRRAGSDDLETVASIPGRTTAALDAAVGAGELVEYSLRALDVDGLESDTGTPIAVASHSYEIEASARPEGVVLRWNPRASEGWVRARIYAQGVLGPTELGTATNGQFVHTGARAGSINRYRVVLERADGRRAPESRVVEVSVPAP